MKTDYEKQNEERVPFGWVLLGSATAAAAFGIGVGLGYVGTRDATDNLADWIIEKMK